MKPTVLGVIGPGFLNQVPTVVVVVVGGGGGGGAVQFKAGGSLVSGHGQAWGSKIQGLRVERLGFWGIGFLSFRS